jgi:hypothetical protein
MFALTSRNFYYILDIFGHKIDLDLPPFCHLHFFWRAEFFAYRYETTLVRNGFKLHFHCSVLQKFFHVLRFRVRYKFLNSFFKDVT